MKKGIPPIGWVGIGCGGLLLVAIVAGVLLFRAGADKIREFTENPEKAGAEMIVSMNPDIEKVSQDDGKGEMTIRTKDGKVTTLTYREISEGKLTVTEADGTETVLGDSDLSKIPAWVPKPPDLDGAAGNFHSEKGGSVTGQFSGKSALSLAELEKFYENSATGLGLTSRNSSSTTLNGTSAATLKYSGAGRSLTVVITGRAGSPAVVSTTYGEK